MRNPRKPAHRASVNLLPKQEKADKEVIDYFLKKAEWSHDEFAALYCGINPFVYKNTDWKKLVFRGDIDVSKNSFRSIAPEYAEFDGVSTTQLFGPRSKYQAINDLATMAKDRGISEHASPSEWRSALKKLELPELDWMKNIKEPEKEADMTHAKKENPKTEKGLTPVERKSFLLIISALLIHAGYDLSETGLAGKISRKTGGKVSDDTVRRRLKEIRDEGYIEEITQAVKKMQSEEQ